jgi:transposase-like protein
VDFSKVVTGPLSHTSDPRLAVPPARSQKVAAFNGSGPLEDRHHNPQLDAKVEKIRDGAQVVRERLVAAHAAHKIRRRGVIALDVAEDTETFSTAFLRCDVARGPDAVYLAISDATRDSRRLSWRSR